MGLAADRRGDSKLVPDSVPLLLYTRTHSITYFVLKPPRRYTGTTSLQNFSNLLLPVKQAQPMYIAEKEILGFPQLSDVRHLIIG